MKNYLLLTAVLLVFNLILAVRILTFYIERAEILDIEPYFTIVEKHSRGKYIEYKLQNGNRHFYKLTIKDEKYKIGDSIILNQNDYARTKR